MESERALGLASHMGETMEGRGWNLVAGFSLKSQVHTEDSEDEDGVSAGPFSMVLLIVNLFVFVCWEG